MEGTQGSDSITLEHSSAAQSRARKSRGKHFYLHVGSRPFFLKFKEASMLSVQGKRRERGRGGNFSLASCPSQAEHLESYLRS